MQYVPNYLTTDRNNKIYDKNPLSLPLALNAFETVWHLPDAVALVKGLNHRNGMFRHQSHQQLQDIQQVVVLRGKKGASGRN